MSDSSGASLRQLVNAVLHYEDCERLPLLHFGYWHETLEKWVQEGHLKPEEANGWGDGNDIDVRLSKKLGFDGNYYNCFRPRDSIYPSFEQKILKELEDGSTHSLNPDGVVVVQKPETGSIPAEIEHTLTDRGSWEEHYKWRFEWSRERIDNTPVLCGDEMKPYGEGGLDFLKQNEHDYFYGLHCGSLYGTIRNILGVEGSCYMMVDDEDLFDEIINTNAELSFKNIQAVLEDGARFDFAHFWEDICFKNGPLIAPSVFSEKVGPHYKRITDLLKDYGIDIISLDCDGCIDSLIPTWLENGVNTMFPIEVGTWDAAIAPWREKYGKDLRGVGGMNKCVFARDRDAINTEVERLKPLVELGGYIPCPDHRIPPDAKFELVCYYTEQMRKTFG